MTQLLFKRILPELENAPAPPRTERRSSPRYAPNPDFPLKAVLGFVGRDEKGELMSASRQGWRWKGTLVDISLAGARMQLGGGLRAKVGDPCDLALSIGDYELIVPSRIQNLGENEDGMVCGLRHDFDTGSTWAAYRQLVEVVALGSTLRLQAAPAKKDASGYVVEQFASPRPARLTFWRWTGNRALAAFEFLLRGNMVRALAGQEPEYLTCASEGPAQRATSARALEIHRLFQWVVPNVAPVVPDDARRFLRTYI